MKYTVRRTDTFLKWLAKLKDKQAIRAIEIRIIRASLGNFGDTKNLSDGIQEMRIFVSKGYRVYYTIKNDEIILLVNGGHKGTQTADIQKAKSILKNLED